MRSPGRRVVLASLLLLSATLLASCAVAAPEAPPPGSSDSGMMGGSAGEGMASGVIAAASNASITVGTRPATSAGIVVGRVLAPSDGWIVVRSVSTPEAVLGRAPVKAGETRDATVRLDRLDGPAVRVALHVDRGVRGKFDFDPILTERNMDKAVFADSAPIERTVQVSGYGVEASPNSVLILVSDQSAAIGGITVRYLLTPRPSWVCVNLVEGGLPARRIGLVSRSAGEWQEFLVPLDARSPRGEVLVTVVADDGVPGRFEYDERDPLGSADRPLLSAGVVVSQRIALR